MFIRDKLIAEGKARLHRGRLIPVMRGGDPVLDAPLAERKRSAQQRVNDAVTAMQTAFEALDGAGRALAGATDENRETLQATFDAASRTFDQAEADVFAAEQEAERIRRMADARVKVAEIGGAVGGASRVTSGDLVYRRFDGRADNIKDPSWNYLRDVYRASCKGDLHAMRRLEQHAEQMAAEGRALSSTSGSGGEFIPPLWLQEDWIMYPRPGRPAARAIRNLPLPPGTESINLPKLTGAPSVATQTDGGAVSSTDPTTGSVTAAVQTKAGQVDVSQQLLDRSVPTIDTILFEQLSMEYDVQIDTEVLNGTPTNGKGLLQLSGTNSSTYTDASPTVHALYSKGADILQKVATSRFLPADLWLMHPRRWAWFLASLDANNRPLVVPNDAPGFNVAAVAQAAGVLPENVAGSWLGVTIVLDSSIPTTLGAGTNEDRIIGLRSGDVFLWEDGVPTTRTHEQVLDNTLQVRLQLYNYFALMTGRLATAIGVISGTGLAAPTF